MITHPVLDGMVRAGIRMGTKRMVSFMEALGQPQKAAPVILVAGTNGKGSVCRMLGSVLNSQGLKVGVYTSPHLVQVNELMRVNERPIDDEALDRLIQRLDLACRAWGREQFGPDEPFPLTWFEFTTALAFQFFADEHVDVMVIEVGMGGRLDATNVVDPVVTAITTVGLDHCDQLGHDHASIAGEKAGILRAGVPGIIGPLPHDALQVVRSVGAAVGAPLSLWGEEFEAHGQPGAFRYRGPQGEREGLAVRLEGGHQVVNSGIAVRILDALPEGLRPTETALRQGLARARHPGRLEWLAPDLLVDGAHNPEGASALARVLALMPHERKRTLVIGGGTDKDVRSIAAALLPHVDHVRTTTSGHLRARSPEDLAATLAGLHADIGVGGTVADSLAAARNGEDLVIVAGSLYLVGAVRRLLLGPDAPG